MKLKEYNSTTYVTTAMMMEDAKALVKQLPSDIDGIIGVARSGLLPATFLACWLHLPLYHVSWDGVKACDGGYRTFETLSDIHKHVLIVDDTIFSGKTMQKCANRVKLQFPDIKISKCVVYCVPNALHKTDYCSVLLPPPHYLEWNFFNSTLLDYSMFDFDGIFCEDIWAEDDDDGARYIKALENAVPKCYVRIKPIHSIVTARLEKYRQITEAWLNKQGMTCMNLIMGPWGNLRERIRHGNVPEFKATQYARSGLRLFVESDIGQARYIFDKTQKAVLCPALGHVLTKK